MSILGIIPAAGGGERWGGFYKELLPIGEREWLIDRTIKTMKNGGADKILVISTPTKISAHANHLSSKHDDILYTVQRQSKDIWGAWLESLPYAEEYNFMAFPDCYIPINTFNWLAYRENKLDFYLGLFDTNRPHRFGVLYNGKVLNKRMDLPLHTTYNAWGTLIWSKKVAEEWLKNKFLQTYTDAINFAIDNFKWGTFNINYYYDMASWKDYVEFLDGNK